MSRTADTITTEAELDTHLSTLQAKKQRRRAREAKLNYYVDIVTLIAVGLLATGYIFWPWLSAGRPEAAVNFLKSIRNLLVLIVVVRAFSYARSGIKAYRQSLRP